MEIHNSRRPPWSGESKKSDLLIVIQRLAQPADPSDIPMVASGMTTGVLEYTLSISGLNEAPGVLYKPLYRP